MEINSGKNKNLPEEKMNQSYNLYQNGGCNTKLVELPLENPIH